MHEAGVRTTTTAPISYEGYTRCTARNRRLLRINIQQAMPAICKQRCMGNCAGCMLKVTTSASRGDLKICSGSILDSTSLRNAVRSEQMRCHAGCGNCRIESAGSALLYTRADGD